MGATTNYFIYFHSIIRYFILLFALIVVIQSLAGMLGKKKFLKSNRMPLLFLLIFCDIQLLIGFVLYYQTVISTGILSSSTLMKNPHDRFFGVEHGLTMLIGIILVHVGYSITKKAIDDNRKFRRVFWCTFIALVLFMAMTPWEGTSHGFGVHNVPAMP